VLVAHAKGRVAGYVTCHASESKNGSIGLLAVAEEYRGCGIGANLMSTALQVFEQKGVETVSVVTQARNIASQRLYQKAGFRTRSVQLWFHRWFNHNG
jgi:ribosomal protein S18 acetylase RimI-like enzyme